MVSPEGMDNRELTLTGWKQVLIFLPPLLQRWV